MSKDVNIYNYMRFYKEDDKAKECCPPICREERQYALYLSNVLRYYGKNPQKRIGDNEKVKNIFKACGFNDVDLKNIVIENVYYEATFMRDFFERNRRYYLAKGRAHREVEYSKNIFKHKDYKISVNDSFNYNLLKYCSEIIYNKTPITESKNPLIAERNYGGRNNFIDESKSEELSLESEIVRMLNEKDGQKWNEFKTLVKSMMNAKPDLAVIYIEKGAKKLLFIECKYVSQEGKYNNNDKDKTKAEEKKLTQTEVQGHIAKFLCQCNGYMNKVQVSGLMEKEGKYLSKMVRFVASQDASNCENSNKSSNESGDNPNNTEEYPINIKDLIQIEEDIFNKNK